MQFFEQFLLFLILQHPIIIGKKKHKDIQFYTEVSLWVDDVLHTCMYGSLGVASQPIGQTVHP